MNKIKRVGHTYMYEVINSADISKYVDVKLIPSFSHDVRSNIKTNPLYDMNKYTQYNVVHINVLPRVREAISLTYGSDGVLKSYEVPKINIPYTNQSMCEMREQSIHIGSLFNFSQKDMYNYDKVFGYENSISLFPRYESLTKTNAQLMLEQSPIVGICEYGPVVTAYDDDGSPCY